MTDTGKDRRPALPARGSLTRRFLAAAAALSAVLLLEGCYYMQAVRGHVDLMQRRRPVAEVLDDPASPAELRAKLELVRQVRQYAVEELGLPDNGSYRSYADLERDFVVWNVFAAPEFSLQAKQWCFPVAGCVAYRGYFREEAALTQARKLADRGYDVAVGGVSAYSTLGRFADPVLNTMLRWNDTDLAATVFHELAHQKLYVKGDTRFNESFATALAEIGLEGWLRARGEPGRLERYHGRKALRRRMLDIVEEHRIELATLYDSDLSAELMRERKHATLDRLADRVDQLLRANGADPPRWLAGNINNARLVSLGLYEGWLPAFRQLYAGCGEDLQCFYDEAARLAGLPEDERYGALILLASRDVS